jgi:predicted DNA-binding transcriptional regulator AlpA
MATTKIKTYDVREVCEMLGMEYQTAIDRIKKSKFPFPVIQVGEKRWVVPRKHVDRVLGGKDGDFCEKLQQNKGRPRIWHKGEYVNWNFPVPNDLAEAFKAVVDALNKTLTSPLTYNQAKLLAFEEFIERRPIED